MSCKFEVKISKCFGWSLGQREREDRDQDQKGVEFAQYGCDWHIKKSENIGARGGRVRERKGERNGRERECDRWREGERETLIMAARERARERER